MSLNVNPSYFLTLQFIIIALEASLVSTSLEDFNSVFIGVISTDVDANSIPVEGYGNTIQGKYNTILIKQVNHFLVLHVTDLNVHLLLAQQVVDRLLVIQVHLLYDVWSRPEPVLCRRSLLANHDGSWHDVGVEVVFFPGLVP